MKYENAIIHVYEKGIEEELTIIFSYDDETGIPFVHRISGKLFVLHGIHLSEIVKAAILKNEYCGCVNGVLNRKELSFCINDYALIKGLEENYFHNSLNYDPNKKPLSKAR